MTIETKKIPELDVGTTPLTGNELIEMVQGGNSVKIQSSAFPPIGAAYITLANNGALTGSRTLVAGSNITLTDSGAGGNITISAAAAAITSFGNGWNWATVPDQLDFQFLNGTDLWASMFDDGTSGTVYFQGYGPTGSAAMAVGSNQVNIDGATNTITLGSTDFLLTATGNIHILANTGVLIEGAAGETLSLLSNDNSSIILGTNIVSITTTLQATDFQALDTGGAYTPTFMQIGDAATEGIILGIGGALTLGAYAAKTNGSAFFTDVFTGGQINLYPEAVGSGINLFAGTPAGTAVGGSIAITAGSGHGANQAAGDITLQLGLATGIGTPGSIFLRDQIANRVQFTAGQLSMLPGAIFTLQSNAPATAASAGVTGTITWDAGFIYICTTTNTWKRVAIATF